MLYTNKNYIVLITLILVGIHGFAQTGPGGCGSAATNVLWLNGNKGVTVSGTAVTQWADQSGNNNHASPNAVANRPTAVAAFANGNTSIDFDGTDDELRVPDHATLDLTQWNIFIVVKPDLQKDYNAWFVKGDDGQENFELLSYSDGNIHMPVWWTSATRTFPNAPVAQVNTATFEIIEYTYSSATGRDLWKNNSAAPVYTDNENTTPSNNNLPLYIGNERSTSGRFVNGHIAEAIVYNAPINSTQKIIVNNYLGAKYNRTLGVNDIYVQDNAGNGNYDYDVAGIGQLGGASQQLDSRGSGIVRVLNASNLNDNEFFIFGHDNTVLGTWGSTDFPAGLQGRWFRTWRVSEVNTAGTAVDVGSVELRFDLTGLGSVTTGDLRLLVDTDNDGIFSDETAIPGASSLGGNIYAFTNVSAIGNNMRFTLGTINKIQTPLPIQLLNFDAQPIHQQVNLVWSTATEINNDYFTVERSADGLTWEEVLQHPGAGNSNSLKTYNHLDASPLEGLSYYRLKQTDFNGLSSCFQEVPVYFEPENDVDVVVFPNPSEKIPELCLVNFQGNEVEVDITDMLGRVHYNKIHSVVSNRHQVVPEVNHVILKGTYLLTVRSGNKLVKKKVIVTG